MQHVVASRPGGPEVLDLIPKAIATVPLGYALVRVVAAGVTILDTRLRAGIDEPLNVGPFPRPMGLEGGGVVEELGSDVGRLLPGDRVAWIGVMGSYATHLLVPADRLVRLPDLLDVHQGTALLRQGLIAHAFVFPEPSVQPGEWILVHAAASGVGQSITRLAKRIGAMVIGTVSNDVKAMLAREAGCDHVIVLRHEQEDVAGRVRELTDGAEISKVYDGVSKDIFRFIGNPDEYGWRANQLMRLAMEGALPVPVTTLPLTEARRAHELLERQQVAGRILLCP